MPVKVDAFLKATRNAASGACMRAELVRDEPHTGMSVST
jgi:hypothetical protein